MPNRILKESICTSETVDQLSAEAEVFWYRLLVQCDDYGRMDARPAILRSRCYPLRLETVSDKDIVRWLNELCRPDSNGVSLVWIYTANGKRYLQVTTWERHQQVRAKRSKYPDPPADVKDLQSDDNNGNQLIADDCNSPRRRESFNEDEDEIGDEDGTKVVVVTSEFSRRDPIADLEYAALCKAYSDNIGLLTPTSGDELALLLDDYPAQWCLDSVREAVLREKRSLAYMKGCLKNWKREGRSILPPSGNGRVSTGPALPDMPPGARL